MAFVYHRINLRGLAALPKDYDSDKRGKLEAMKDALLNEILSGKITQVEIDKKVFNLIPQFDVELEGEE